MALTKEFWKNIKNYDVFLSKITIQEINLITDKKLKADILKLVQFFKVLKIYSKTNEENLGCKNSFIY